MGNSIIEAQEELERCSEKVRLLSPLYADISPSKGLEIYDGKLENKYLIDEACCWEQIKPDFNKKLNCLYPKGIQIMSPNKFNFK